MNDITEKIKTLRSATAEGYVLCSKETLARVKANTLPKGDLFGVAKAAGLLAAKKTSELIPHCHPVSIDSCQISFSLVEEETRFGVRIEVNAKSIGRTGIEIEALTSVSVTALTVYDLLKPIDKALTISSIQLLEKKGGKTQSTSAKLAHGSSAAILVCSDSVFNGKKEDGSGQLISSILETHGVMINDFSVVPDESFQIKEKVLSWVNQGLDLIVTTGGTGLGPRDVTPNTIEPLLEQRIPGIEETMRSYGQERTPFAMLSRSLAGRISKTIILCLPGSTNGASESLNAILPSLFHAKKMMRGAAH